MLQAAHHRVTVVNLTAIDADGQINNSNGSFISNTVINQTGCVNSGQGELSAIAGWANFGAMVFSSGVSNVYGAVNNLAGGVIGLGDNATVVFNGDVIHNGSDIAMGNGSSIEFKGTLSGIGNYTGAGTVTMDGSFRPGNRPGVVSIGGDLEFGVENTTNFELGGLSTGACDQLLVGGDLTLGNSQLDVSLWNGFTLGGNMQFLVADVNGSLIGQFGGLGEGSLIGNFGGTDLFINYNGFGGNGGVGFFTSAVPEPGSLVFVGMTCLLGLVSRRRNRI